MARPDAEHLAWAARARVAPQVATRASARLRSKHLPVQLIVRHQAGSLLASLLDFSTMIALVSGLGSSPALGAMLGAAVGGSANYTLGRFWIFRDQGESMRAQGLRYACVSLASLGLNGAGEYLLASVWTVQFVFARVCVALSVSLLWNFPMQRYFVFRHAVRS